MREGEGSAGPPPAPEAAVDLVDRYLCLSVDVRGYGSQDDVRQAEIQCELIALLDEAGKRSDSRRHGAARNAAIALRAIALARVHLGEFDEAIRGLLAAKHEFEQLGSDLDIAMTLNALGEAHGRSGHPVAADDDHRQALAVSQRCGSRYGSRYEAARAHHQLGQLALAAGDRHEARGLLLQAYQSYRELGAPQASELAGLLAAATGESSASPTATPGGSPGGTAGAALREPARRSSPPR